MVGRMMALTADDIEALAAGAGHSPAALFAAIHQVARRRLDATLVTVMRHHAAEVAGGAALFVERAGLSGRRPEAEA